MKPNTSSARKNSVVRGWRRRSKRNPAANRFAAASVSSSAMSAEPIATARTLHFSRASRTLAGLSWQTMTRHLLASVLACSIGAAPLAAELCQALCAGTGRAAETTNGHSHHHAAAPQPDATAVDAIAPECGRFEATPPRVREAAHRLTIETAIATLVAALSRSGVSKRSAIETRHGPPPLFVRSASPLRI